MTSDAFNYRRQVAAEQDGRIHRSAWGVFTTTAAQIKALPEVSADVQAETERDRAYRFVLTLDAIRRLPTYGGPRC